MYKYLVNSGVHDIIKWFLKNKRGEILIISIFFELCSANFCDGFQLTNFMCTLLTDPYCAKLKFYRKPRYTHFCSVWNIILSSLYQKCTIWTKKSSGEKNYIKNHSTLNFLSWSKIKRWNFTWLLVNRWHQPP